MLKENKRYPSLSFVSWVSSSLPLTASLIAVSKERFFVLSCSEYVVLVSRRNQHRFGRKWRMQRVKGDAIWKRWKIYFLFPKVKDLSETNSKFSFRWRLESSGSFGYGDGRWWCLHKQITDLVTTFLIPSLFFDVLPKGTVLFNSSIQR